MKGRHKFVASANHRREELTTDDNNTKVTVLWSELDFDSLGEIMGRLSLIDQARFHTVCKTWYAAHPTTNKISSLPLFVCVHILISRPPICSITLEFRTYQPLYADVSTPELISVHKISLTKSLIPMSPFPEYEIMTNPAKHGWSFIWIIRKTRQSYLSYTPSLCFLLFSPLTKKLITLPHLDYPDRRCNFVTTFSTDPNSPDCVFILVQGLGTKTVIATFRNSDQEWKSRDFDLVIDLRISCSIPVYIEGVFYIVSSTGQLASYNTIDEKFKYETRASSLDIHDLYSYKVFMLDGELMLMYVSNNDMFSIKRFDWTNKNWVPISNLGDDALFLLVKDQTLSLAKVGKEAVKNNGLLSNKIYCYCDWRCYIYSLENGTGDLVQIKLYSLEDDGDLVQIKSQDVYGTTTKTTLIKSLLEISLLEYKYHSVIMTEYDETDLSFFWLEPPVIV